MVAFGRTCSASLREALTLAVVAIALLLLALWRRPGDVALALAPLLLASAWCVGVMVVFDWRFNFANVIVLPLLLGIGVDSGIHLVSRSRRSLARGESLAATTTGRAVFFSAGTTLLSFGSLAFSAHRGIASLGQLLVLGMTFTLVANLVVLPALIALRTQLRSGLVEPAPVSD
jgi:predicted RND superfamily exporter protein